MTILIQTTAIVYLETNCSNQFECRPCDYSKQILLQFIFPAFYANILGFKNNDDLNLPLSFCHVRISL